MIRNGASRLHWARQASNRLGVMRMDTNIERIVAAIAGTCSDLGEATARREENKDGSQ